MVEALKKKVKHLTWAFSSVIVILVIALGYTIYHYNNQVQTLQSTINTLDSKLNQNVQTLNKQIEENDQLTKTIETDVLSLGQKVIEDVATINGNINSLETKNNLKFQSLDGVIEEIETQSNLQLENLREDLEKVQVAGDDFSSVVDDVVDSVVSVITSSGAGSGAYIDNRGFVVTNYHVVDDGSQIIVQFSDDKAYTANLIGFDEEKDVAVVQTIDNKPTISWGNSDNVKVGEKVIAVGNPVGLSFTVTQGIVSAVKREGTNNLPIYIQTDVPINPGNSGGPLINANGKIIGINNFKVSGFEGLGFALESEAAEETADQIISDFLNGQSS